MCDTVPVQRSEDKFGGDGSFLQVCGSLRLSPGQWTWQQAPLPAEPSSGPLDVSFWSILKLTSDAITYVIFSLHSPAYVT